MSNIVHVISQGIKKEYIFNRKVFKEKYLELIQENSEKFNIKIIANCIMDNHVHMCLFYEKIENLSQFMHQINSCFANFYNKLESREGYVFKNRYYLQEIYNRQQLFNVIAYIHNNPVKANMVSNPEDYKYSTYMDYINQQIEQSLILLIFESKDYIETFNYIHKNYEEAEIIEIEEDIKILPYKEVISNFLRDNKISINLLKKDDNLLIYLVKELKDKSRLSGKEISNILKINKNRVTEINKTINKKGGFLTRPQILSYKPIDKSLFARF